MDPQWRVESYFINVGLGDGAIHLLLDGSRTQKSEQIISAVLIDGGLRGRDQIEFTTQKIIEKYEIPNTTPFSYSAVVVTHWDRDHYEATMSMLQSSFKSQDYEKCRWISDKTVFYLPETSIGVQPKDGLKKAYVVDKTKTELHIRQIDNKKPGPKKEPSTKKLAKAVCGKACIGIDLFSGHMIGKGDKFIIGSNDNFKLNDILKNTTPIPHLILNRPMFLCVGIDFKLINGNEIPQVSSTKTNASSMMCLLLKWNKIIEKFDVQLYSGGDAEDYQEEVLQDWLVESEVEKVNIIKCGHHGSSNATHSKLFDLKPEYFIISAGEDHGHPTFFGSRHKKTGIYSTRYPYWLLYPTDPSEVTEKKHLNIEKLLDRTQSFYREELKRLHQPPLTDKDSDVVENWFPKFSNRLDDVYKVMNEVERREYDHLFTSIHEYQGKVEGDTRDLWYRLQSLDAKKWELWSSLQKDVIKEMKAYWSVWGMPSASVSTESLSRLVEVQWIYVKFFDENNPKPQIAHYPTSEVVNISTKYLASKNIARPKIGIEVADQLLTLKEKLQKASIKKGTKVAKESYEADSKKNKKRKDDPTMISIPVPELHQAAALEEEKDDVELSIWDFLTQDLLLSSIQAGSPKRFEVAKETAGSLVWLQESVQASAVEITLKKGDAVTSNIQNFAIFSKISSTASLKFTSSPEVLKLQFGDFLLNEVNFRGYHSDLSTVLFGLDIQEIVSLNLAQFASLVRFGWDGVSEWIVKLIEKIPLEIRAPPNPTASSPVDSSRLKRCGIWVQPQFGNRTILRLESVVPGGSVGMKAFADFIQDHLQGSNISQIRVIGSACSTLTESPSEVATAADFPNQILVHQESQLSFAGSLIWAESNSSVDFAASMIAGTSISLFLQPPKDFSLKRIVDWIVMRFSSSMGESDRNEASNSEDGFRKILDNFAKSIIPRQVSLVISEGPILAAFQIDVELQLNIGSNGKHVPIHGEVRWVPGRLELLGEIWSLEDQSLVPFNLHPYRETFSELMPDASDAIDSIYIPNLFDPDAKVDDFLKSIPLNLTEASVKLTVGDWKKLLITGKLQCVPPKTDDEIMPAIWLDELQLMYLRDISAGTNEFELSGNINLEAPDHIFSANVTSVVRVYVGYNEGWTLSAEAVDLQVANLYSLLPIDGSNHALMSLMANIWIPDLSLTVSFANQQATTVDFEGMFLIGPLQMNLIYRHNSNGWDFSGKLRATPLEKEDATLEDLLDDFIHEHIASFPNFIRNFKIPFSKMSANLTCASKTLAESTSKDVVFSFTVTVQTGETEKDNFSFTFAQIQNQNGAFPEQSDQGKTKPKRILRFSLAGLPEAKNIPVVQDLPQPFDEIDFLWVSEDVTVAEARLLNQEVFTGNIAPLHWKTTALKGEAEDYSKARALASGCHFQLILREQNQPTCALDYVFNGSNKTVTPSKPDPEASLADSVPQPGASAPGGTAMTPVTRSSKGLTIRNIGLKMKDKKTLSIILDAIVTLGPLAFNMIGFQVDIDFENFKAPSDISKLGVGFSLNGLAVSFSRPPATLAGVFAREVTGKFNTYSGGLAVGVGDWQFLAAGVYEELEDFNTLFVFAKLNGPVISFGFAEVNGLVGGFGSNSSLRFPAIEEVTQFPFVSINTGGPTAGNVIEQFAALTSTKGDKAWFKSQKDSIWLAAGLGIKAFQVLDMQAVVCIDLSPNPKIGIFAEAVATLPKGASEDKSFLFLDIGIAAIFDPGAGTLSLNGQLTPRSYVLSKSCKLSGGFALIYFFPASGHDGDWVFTAGGYHPAFRVPSHYPQNVNRVGIAWSYDSDISITGEAYFAITPQVVMGGGRLDLVYQSGHTRASFSAYADFLIFYEPFLFQARVGVNVFASARIGWKWLSIDVSTEISAEVELHGPPIAGVAHLHFWFFSISVRFGPDHAERDPLDWFQFYTLVKQCHELSEAKALPDHLLNLRQGRLSSDTKNEIAPTPKKGEKPPLELWLVRAPLFEFEIMARFPLREVKYNSRPDEGVKALAQDIYSTPMKRGNPFPRSELVVSIKEATNNSEVDFLLEPIRKNIPGALWNRYDSNKSLLNSDSTVKHIMGIKFKPAQAHESDENLPPINMKDFHSILVGGKNFIFPSTEYVHELDVKPIKERNTIDPGAGVNQEAALKLWDNLRHHTTNGGPR